MAVIVHSFIREPLYLHADYRDEKLALIAQWQHRVNAAAFGTSRLHEGFNPAVFDAGFAGTPYAINSLNLAIVGGSQTEQRAMAREFLKHNPPQEKKHVCFVMLEINAGLNLPPENRFNPRAVNLYDWDTLRFVHTFNAATSTAWRKLGRIGFALLASAAHYANAGMVSSAVFSPVGKDFESGEGRGLITVPPSVESTHQVEAALASYPKRPAVYAEAVLPGNRLLLDDLASGADGAQFIYIVPPMLSDLERMPEYPASMEGPNGPVPILNLARPDRYPDLYEARNWQDPVHLSAEGAASLSRILGREVVRWLHKNPNPRCGR